MTRARRLSESLQLGFVGDVKAGKFDLPVEVAKDWLSEPNPHGRPNSDVTRPWANGLDVLRRPRHFWIVDYPSGISEAEAARFQIPFAHIRESVLPERSKVKRAKYRRLWWVHAEPCDEMRRQVERIERFLVTPTTSKHRVFSWMSHPILPDHQLIAFALDDDYSFGVLHSRVHETWARSTGTQLREAESGFRYTPTTCFETFAFPAATEAQRQAIGEAARELDMLRTRWLNPPEWVVEDVLEFPASVDGPWARQVEHPNADGIGTAKYVRLLARDEEIEPQLRKRTLTHLYNERPAWLDQAHRALDEAVFAAYGWSSALSDEALLGKLLELNLSRPSAGAVTAAEVDEEE